MRRRLLIGLSAVSVPVLVAGVVGWAGADQAIHPRRAAPMYSLAEFGLQDAAEAVRFPSLDGTPLAGWFIVGNGPASATIVLLHGYGQSKDAMLPHAAYLHRAGYNVLLFDFRHSGQSGGDAVTFGMKEPLDVRGAVAYVTTRPDVDASRVAIQAVSLGASSGLLAMAADPRIKAAVAESAFTDLDAMINQNFQSHVGLPPVPFATLVVLVMERRLGGSAGAVRPIEAVRRLGNRPVLIIDDAADSVNPPGAAEQLYAAASGPKTLWTIAGAGHAMGYFREPASYQERVLRFFAQVFN